MLAIERAAVAAQTEYLVRVLPAQAARFEGELNAWACKGWHVAHMEAEVGGRMLVVFERVKFDATAADESELEPVIKRR